MIRIGDQQGETTLSIKELYTSSDAVGLADHVAKGEVSANELLSEALRCVEALNPKLNAVILVNEPKARGLIQDGLLEGPLKGVPFLLKDLGGLLH